MPFVSNDYKRVQLYLNYPYESRTSIQAHMEVRASQYGESYVTEVQAVLTALDAVQAELTTAQASETNVQRIRVEGEYAIEYQQGSSTDSSIQIRKSELIRQLHSYLNIPFNFLQPKIVRS